MGNISIFLLEFFLKDEIMKYFSWETVFKVEIECEGLYYLETLLNEK